MKFSSKLFIILALAICPALFAKQVQTTDVTAVVQNWLAVLPAPLETRLGAPSGEVYTQRDTAGTVLYHAVLLQPSGFVIVSPDDDIEPIIAFSAVPFTNLHKDAALVIMLEKDMHGRLDQVAKLKQSGKSAQLDKNKNKWLSLQSAAPDQPAMAPQFSAPLVNDIRVSPFLNSLWGQGDEFGSPCYNYYTPNHYPCGCVSTAVSKLMRYHQHPTSGIGVRSCSIEVDGYPQTAYTRGGNGSGGPYLWSQMPLAPDNTITPTQRQAIGALCYDIGIILNTGYTSSGSGASTQAASTALVNTFGYSQTVYGSRTSGQMPAGLTAMLNPNLDASLPVILDISSSGADGHAVVADGYGYIGSTMYHHVDLGWNGSGNAWYALPDIDTSTPFNMVDGCLYNIFTTGTGEIVSGRVTDSAGNPLPSVTVSVMSGTITIAQATTNTRGIYAFTRLASNTSYTITAVKTGYLFTSQPVTTGHSQHNQSTSGNRWQVNFASTIAGPPTAYEQTVSVRSGRSETITLSAGDDGLPNPPAALTYRITSLPRFGYLLAGSSRISSVPYTLSSNIITYKACPYFTGNDSFLFTADDGGSSPSGGQSTPAAVTLQASNSWTYTFDPDAGVVGSDPIDTSCYAMRTQALYLASEIGAAQTINSLSLDFYTPPGTELKNFTIRLQHTSMTAIPSDVVAFWLNSGWTTVYQANVAATPSSWRTFTFSSPFRYNGTSNLMIDFSFNNTVTASPGYVSISQVPADRQMSLKADTLGHPSPLTWDFWEMDGYYWPWDNIPNIRLSSSVTADPVPGDIDSSCRVDLADLAQLGSTWLKSSAQPGFNARCDLNTPKDNVINFKDMLVISGQWLHSYSY